MAAWGAAGPAQHAGVFLRDQSYHPQAMRDAQGSAPLQSVEGLSLGLDLNDALRLDPTAVASKGGATCPDNVGADIVEPAVQGWCTRCSHATRCARSSRPSAQR